MKSDGDSSETLEEEPTGREPDGTFGICFAETDDLAIKWLIWNISGSFSIPVYLLVEYP